MKRLFYLAIAILLFAASAEAAPPRNVVLFVVDDMGKTMGCYGDSVAKTPHMDWLASQGTRFDYAFCTTASCSASRSVILSGLHNHLNGQYGHQHSFHHFASFDHVQSLPVILSTGGYRTVSIGKYHVAPESVYHFDTYLKGNQGGARNTVSMAEKCRELIEAKDEKPFFLYFCTNDPHRGGGKVESDSNKPDYFGNNMKYDGVEEVKFDPKKVIVPSFLPDTPACRAELAQYYQSVARVDQGLGRLIKILKDAGQWDNTLFIFTTDNGIAMPGAKTTLYEPGMRLPLIVCSPDQKTRSGATDAMVSWVDFTPTILDFAGVKPPTVKPGGKEKPKPYSFHGRSFLSVLGQEKTKEWDTIHASHTFHEITMYYPMRVIHTRQHKLIVNLAHQLPYPFASDLYESATWQSVLKQGRGFFGKRPISDYINRARYELFDLKTDPDEIVNQAPNPKYAKILKDLQDRLKKFQQYTGDPWVVKYNYE